MPLVIQNKLYCSEFSLVSFFHGLDSVLVKASAGRGPQFPRATTIVARAAGRNPPILRLQQQL